MNITINLTDNEYKNFQRVKNDIEVFNEVKMTEAGYAESLFLFGLIHDFKHQLGEDLQI